ncbi:hypothetical protein VK98_17000 [Chromobacterium sp. LK11]|nr:hypothetical protein VK98_17000 [Chromobacterium sp. LK11]
MGKMMDVNLAMTGHQGAATRWADAVTGESLGNFADLDQNTIFQTEWDQAHEQIQARYRLRVRAVIRT